VLGWSQERPGRYGALPASFGLVGEMGRTNEKISPQRVLEAMLKKALAELEKETPLKKTSVDGVVQLLKLYKEYGGNEEGMPKKLRVIWLDEMKAKGQEE
jgi:hypothetical protein